MLNTQLLTFIGVATILTITPGVDTMLVIRNVLARGQRAGVLTALGICSGLFCHATVSALGLSVILVRSAVAFEVVKFVGACYLMFLGGRSLWQVVRAQGHGKTEVQETDPVAVIDLRGYRWRSVREGFLSNVLNPKVAVFYLAFLPQFINAGDPVLGKSLLLAGIHFVLGMVWLSLVTVLLGWFRLVLSRRVVRQGMEAVTGVVLIGFGVRLAVERG